MSTLWTVVTRKPRGRYMHPVPVVPGTWHDAVEAARVIAEARPDLEVWYVPTRESQADGWPEDRDNVMLPSGRRLPIRWDSEPQFTF